MQAMGAMYVYGKTAKTVPKIPQLKRGEIYLVNIGRVFHTEACPIIQRVWEYNRKALSIRPEREAGPRARCGHCSTAGTS